MILINDSIGIICCDERIWAHTIRPKCSLSFGNPDIARSPFVAGARVMTDTEALSVLILVCSFRVSIVPQTAFNQAVSGSSLGFERVV